MRVQWLLPSAAEVQRTAFLSGVFYVVDKLESPVPYSVVRDVQYGYNMVRVEWTPEELALPTKERMTVMDSMRILSEIKYDQLKENNEPTF